MTDAALPGAPKQAARAAHGGPSTGTRKIRFSQRSAILAVAAAVLCAGSFLFGKSYEAFVKEMPVVVLHEVQGLDTCVDEVIRIVDIKTIGDLKERNAALTGIHYNCYVKGNYQAGLNEFQIRRLQFMEQYYDERVFLWMVVCITIAGVVLAGLQLGASYRLSLLGRGALAESAEMTVQHDKLVLKSSVTGIFILIISFAFFALYTFEIYEMKEVSPGGASKTSTDQKIDATSKVNPILHAIRGAAAPPVPVPPPPLSQSPSPPDQGRSAGAAE